METEEIDSIQDWVEKGSESGSGGSSSKKSSVSIGKTKHKSMAATAIAASENLKSQKSGGGGSGGGEHRHHKNGQFTKKIPSSSSTTDASATTPGDAPSGEKSLSKKKKKKPDFSKLNRYIRKVIASECQGLDIDVSISEEACNSINSFAMDKRKQIVAKANELLQINDKKTLTSREIVGAVLLLYPCELATPVVKLAVDACDKFKVSEDRIAKEKKQTSDDALITETENTTTTPVVPTSSSN